MKNPYKTVNINEIKYVIKNDNDLIQKFLLNNRQWNNNILHIIGQLIKRFNLKHFLNIGCHIGTVALPLSKYIEKVTAIEAYPMTFKHLEEHIKINNIKNIQVFNLAIGDENKKIYFLNDKNIRIRNNTGGMHVITEDDISNKRLFYQFDDFGMDGMRCDIEGNLYITRYGKGTVAKLSPEGKLLLEIQMKGKKPSNITFGGKDGKTAFVTLQDRGYIETFRVEKAGNSFVK